MPKNNIAETLRNYAELPEVGPMFKCVLAEAAATLDSIIAENVSLSGENKILREEIRKIANKV